MATTVTNYQPIRVATIDVFRALTMFFMIVVNDFHSIIPGVPLWLDHAARDQDFLGFSDIILPAFLFVMGMSIPHAIEKRFSNGETKMEVFGHIIMRTVALVAMGFFAVNWGALSSEVWLSRPVFTLVALGAFFLIWNVYPSKSAKKWLPTTLFIARAAIVVAVAVVLSGNVISGFWLRLLIFSIVVACISVIAIIYGEKLNKKWFFTAGQVIGIGILLYLAIIYQDRTGSWMQTRWWGILGLIGWSYVFSAIVYLFVRAKFKYLIIFWAIAVLLSMLAANSWLGGFHGIIHDNGTLQAFSMSGVLLSLLFTKWFTEKKSPTKLIQPVIAIGFVFLLAGFLARQAWIISKLTATPTWLFFCVGITTIVYAFLYWLVEIKGKANWFNIIAPAGTATLTCFLIPSIVYAVMQLAGFSFRAPTNPDWLLTLVTFPQGLLKTVAFSLFCIGITYLLGKIGVKLKV